MNNKPTRLRAIRSNVLYPAELLREHAGIGADSLRKARRQGLKLSYIHGRAYVWGGDWISYVREKGKKTKDE